MTRNSPSPDCPETAFFIDGQNLFLSIKSLYGYQHPNFDVVGLCQALACDNGLSVGAIHFYTGMPGREENPHWHDYWQRRLEDLRAQVVQVYSPAIRYRPHREVGADGSVRTIVKGSEKGVDVRIALDMVRAAHDGVAAQFLLSQDNDLAVAVDEVKWIAREASRSMQVLCAYPVGEGRPSRGVEGTLWRPMERTFYDLHIDPVDHRTMEMRRVHEHQERRAMAFRDGRLMGQRPIHAPGLSEFEPVSADALSGAQLERGARALEVARRDSAHGKRARP